MQLERTVLEKPLSDFDQSVVNEYFRRITRIDVNDIDPRYANKVKKTKEYLMENCVAHIVMRADEISERGEDYLQLECGDTFRGKMPVRVMKRAQQMFTIASSVSDADEQKKPAWKISEEYFYDSWGSAFIVGIDAWIDNQLKSMIDDGMILTSAWEPGHYQFDIHNQEVVFDLLNPQEFGCTLKPSMLVIPEKTKTCIIGIVPEDTEDLPVPCAYCRFGKTCPASRLLTGEDFPQGGDTRRARARRCVAIDPEDE